MGSGPRHTATATWTARDHVVGTLLGAAFVLALWGQSALQGQLMWIAQTQVRVGALWAIWVLDATVGLVAALIVLLAPRWPALPTTALGVIVYGVLGDSFGPLREWGLPDLGPWHPRLTGFAGDRGHWDPTEVLLVGGVMVVASLWGWTRPLRTRRAISSALPVDDTPTGDGDGATDSVRNPDGVRDV
jgi:hypothetical protein